MPSGSTAPHSVIWLRSSFSWIPAPRLEATQLFNRPWLTHFRLDIVLENSMSRHNIHWKTALSFVFKTGLILPITPSLSFLIICEISRYFPLPYPFRCALPIGVGCTHRQPIPGGNPTC